MVACSLYTAVSLFVNVFDIPLSGISIHGNIFINYRLKNLLELEIDRKFAINDILNIAGT